MVTERFAAMVLEAFSKRHGNRGRYLGAANFSGRGFLMNQKPRWRTTGLACLSAALFLTGCNDRIPIVTSLIGNLGPRGDYSADSILATGANTRLPSPGTRAVVWGLGRSDHDLSVENSAITWLQGHGLVVIERAQLEQLFTEQKLRLLHGDSDAELLRVGKLLRIHK